MSITHYPNNSLEALIATVDFPILVSKVMNKYLDKYKDFELQILSPLDSFTELITGFINSKKLYPTKADFDIDFIEDYLVPKLEIIEDTKFLLEVMDMRLYINSKDKLIEFLIDIKSENNWDVSYIIGLNSGLVIHNSSMSQHAYFSNI